MFSRPTLKVILLYATSIFLFWNVVIAIRAYRFTHFNTPSNTAAYQQAGFFNHIIERIGGSKYYKLPNTVTPRMPFANLAITTSDNLKLQSWYIANTAAKGTCIVLHGLGGNRSQMITEINNLHQLGYNVLAVDFRAHGNSEGSATSVGMVEANDVKAAYDYVAQLGEKNIILYGASMGAASIASCIKQYPQVAPSKIVLDMPFDNFEHLMERFFRNSKYPTQPTFTLFTFWSSVFNGKWMFNVNPQQYVKSIKCPTLVQWGMNDEIVPQHSIRNIVDNITAKKQFVVYNQSAHESFAKKENEKWKQTVSNFLTQP